jgi:hypothetical protein
VLKSRSLVFALVLVLLGMTGWASIHRSHSGWLSAWRPGVEVRFPGTAPPVVDEQPGASSFEESSSDDDDAEEVVVAHVPAVSLGKADRKGVIAEDDTFYTLHPGTHAFRYEPLGLRTVFGEIRIFAVSSPRARDFLKHQSISVTPDPSGGESVLSEADLARAMSGDVVTKVLFLCDLGAARERLDDVEQGLRDVANVRGAMEEQATYWERRLRERRLNTRLGGDLGWGADVPGVGYALLQAVYGPERYHWHRLSRADDQLRTYRDQIGRLDRVEQALREEHEALQQLLSSADVVHRRHDLVVLAPSMTRPFHDPVAEVEGVRGGAFGGRVYWPYYHSSIPNRWLPPAFRAVRAPSLASSRKIGEVLMIVEIGTRGAKALQGERLASRN